MIGALSITGQTLSKRAAAASTNTEKLSGAFIPKDTVMATPKNASKTAVLQFKIDGAQKCALHPYRIDVPATTILAATSPGSHGLKVLLTFG